ncbi:MAG: ribonuclease III [Hyphomicrobiaceae bacterium]|nr:ribonuclease III [Hyphomicrobiaceae bacterium]
MGLTALQDRIGYGFKNRKLLEKAVIHASARERKRQAEDNERLEFLGDRVLGLTISELLYDEFPKAPEGELARRFNRLVRKETCALVSKDMDLGNHLVLSPSEKAAGGTTNVNILGDACEAVLGAVFIDGGFIQARALIRRFWEPLLLKAEEIPIDPKTALQEWAQGNQLKLPRYVEVSRTGPDHEPVFLMQVIVERIAPEQGQGSSKRMAEREAAAALLIREGVWKENQIYE